MKLTFNRLTTPHLKEMEKGHLLEHYLVVNSVSSSETEMEEYSAFLLGYELEFAMDSMLGVTSEYVMVLPLVKVTAEQMVFSMAAL